MKPRQHTYFALLGALLLLLLVFWWSGVFKRSSTPIGLTVALVAVENSSGHPRIGGPTILNNITGLCATFSVTNAANDAAVWFDTSAVEQRLGSGWRRIPVPPYATRIEQRASGSNPWWGIASDDVPMSFLPGMSYYFVVEWPRDVPTNASWRLELCYGPAPNSKAERWTDKLGVTLFSKRPNGQTIYTSEVRQ